MHLAQTWPRKNYQVTQSCVLSNSTVKGKGNNQLHTRCYKGRRRKRRKSHYHEHNSFSVSTLNLPLNCWFMLNLVQQCWGKVTFSPKSIQVKEHCYYLISLNCKHRFNRNHLSLDEVICLLSMKKIRRKTHYRKYHVLFLNLYSSSHQVLQQLP